MLRNIFLKLFPVKFCVFILLATHSIYVNAQTGILSPNNAVMTGYSQSTTSDEHAENFIDLKGPSVRIIALPSSSDLGLIHAAKSFSVQAKDIGQVFGVAIDNAAQPNFYVAATSAYGLAIFEAGKGRLQNGSPAAEYVAGLFGPANQGGSATSIWRIDGTTGAVTLFANVSYKGVENTPASLGGLTFDAASQQLFVANLATGTIHRFTLDGTERSVFDHGEEALAAAGQTSVAFDSSHIVTIKNPQFEPKNPDTWGFAPIERRVVALAAYNNRIYYSVAVSQIWSVGIATDGSFAHDARFEVDTGTAHDQEVSAIAFDNNGWMYVAERSMPSGNEDNQTKNRVLRFSPRSNSSSSLWNSPEEYSVGMKSNYQNAAGGVDLTCDSELVMTGNRLINDIHGLQGNKNNLFKPKNSPPQKSWLVNYYDHETNDAKGKAGAVTIWKVCGTTSLAASTTPNAATPIPIPPLFSPQCPGFCPSAPVCPECCFWLNPWFGNGWGWGNGIWGGGAWGGGIWGGGIWGGGAWGGGIWGGGIWGGGIWGINPWWGGLGGIDPWLLNPWWGMPWMDPWFNPCGSFCTPCIVLPLNWCPGLLFGDHCFSNIWPFAILNNQFKNQTAPAPITCKSSENLINGKCVPKTSPMVCKSGERLIQGKCVPTTINCKTNERLVNGKCVPIPITCKSNERLVNGKCVPNPILCKTNERLVNGKCIPLPVNCKPNERLINGKCVPIPITCKPNERLIYGKCVPIVCKPGQHLINGKCITQPINCKPYERLINGKCIPNPIKCKPYERLINGKCVPATTPPNCKTGERLINGKCVPIQSTLCRPWERLVNGKCVSVTQPTKPTTTQTYLPKKSE